MAVDKRYVEEVKDENEYDKIMEELGLEGSFKQSGNGLDLDEYLVTNLRDMYAGDDYYGKPVITDIYTTEFTNKTTGETTVNHKVDLVLLNDDYDDEKEAYIFTCNLNKPENINLDKGIVKDVYSSSGLYALAMGLADLKSKGISKCFNHLDAVSIKRLQKQVKTYERMTVTVIEKKMVDRQTKEEKFYNAFRIIEAE